MFEYGERSDDPQSMGGRRDQARHAVLTTHQFFVIMPASTVVNRKQGANLIRRKGAESHLNPKKTSLGPPAEIAATGHIAAAWIR